MEKFYQDFFKLMKRLSAVAGAFYPAEYESLDTYTKSLLTKTTDYRFKNLKGIIVPHAGYRYSGAIAAMGFKQLEQFADKKMTVFILAPAHRYPITASVGAYEFYESPLGDVPVNLEICKKLPLEFVPQAHQKEHAIEVQIPFLQQVLGNFKIVPILCGNIEAEYLAQILKPYFGKEDCIFVFSSDLSHFLPAEEAEEVDRDTIEIISGQHLEDENLIDACGHVPIKVAMRLADHLKLLEYRHSGNTGGDRGSVVGYASFVVLK